MSDTRRLPGHQELPAILVVTLPLLAVGLIARRVRLLERFLSADLEPRPVQEYRR